MSKVDILGIKIDQVTETEAHQRISQFLESAKCHQIVTVNPEFIMLAQKDPDFAAIINDADLACADGTGLRCAAKFLKIRTSHFWLRKFLENISIGILIGLATVFWQKYLNILPATITGVDLVWYLAKYASKNNFSIYFLGGQPGIAYKAAKNIKKIYPNLKIAGVSHGIFYQGKKQSQIQILETKVVQQINQSGADILLVAYGAPRQDRFIAKYKNDLKVKIAIGVGGTFDYIAGVATRAPKFLRRMGLEWLIRLIFQPARFNRIFTAIIHFPWKVFWWKMKVG